MSTLATRVGRAGAPGGPLAGLAFLDLFAGSGAVGLEAASWGAGPVLLVESDPAAARVAAANLAALALPGVQLRRTRVERLAASWSGPVFDVAFADPPYQLPADTVAGVLVDLASAGALAVDAAVVVERATRDAPWAWPSGFVAEHVAGYGDATLWYGRAAQRPDEVPDADGQRR